MRNNPKLSERMECVSTLFFELTKLYKPILYIVSKYKFIKLNLQLLGDFQLGVNYNLVVFYLEYYILYN